MLVGTPSTVHCAAPPWGWRGKDGWARPAAHQIWVKDCPAVLQRDRRWTVLLGHEILHLRYPRMAHPRVYALDDAWGRKVRREIRRRR